MNITIHWLTLDLHNSNLETEVFTSEEALWDRLKAYMEERLAELASPSFSTEDVKPGWMVQREAAAAEVRALIALGKLHEAWGVFSDRDVKDEDDYIYWGDQALERPGAAMQFELLARINDALTGNHMPPVATIEQAVRVWAESGIRDLQEEMRLGRVPSDAGTLDELGIDPNTLGLLNIDDLSKDDDHDAHIAQARMDFFGAVIDGLQAWVEETRLARGWVAPSAHTITGGAAR